MIYAFYADCDPIANDQIKKADQVVLIFCFVLFLLISVCLFVIVVFFSELITLFISKVVPFICFFYMYSTDPAIFCDECLRITVWCTWFIYGLSL